MNSKIQAHAALFGANLIYAANYIFAKDVMNGYVQPFGFILLRVVGALILFWGLHWAMSKEKIDKKDFPRIIFCGLFGVAINQLLFFKGLNWTSPINASILMTTNPVLVLLFSAIFLGMKLTWTRILGIVLGLCGAVLLIVHGSSEAVNLNGSFGDLCVFINSASYGIYLVMVKPLMKKYKPLTVIKWVFLFGLFFVIPFGFEEFTQINWQSMPTDIYLKVLYVIIGTTFFAYLFNIFGLKVLNPSIASTYIYLQPVLATMFAILLGKDEPTMIGVVSTIIIFTGVYLVSKQTRIKG